jgi:hypothetical protein
MKKFHLFRNKDYSGVSGVGVVAEGVEFSCVRRAVCVRVTRACA